MLSLHHLLDINILHKGGVGDARWVEFEIVGQEGIHGVTMYCNKGTNLFRKFDRIAAFIAEERTNPDSPFYEVSLPTEIPNAD